MTRFLTLIQKRLWSERKKTATVAHRGQEIAAPTTAALQAETPASHEPSVAHEPELPVQEHLDASLAAATTYLAQLPSGFDKVSTNNSQSPIQVDRFRALNGLVLGDGWSSLEEWGVWSDGDRADLHLKNPFSGGAATSSIDCLGEIVIDAKGAVSESHPKLKVRFTLGTAETDVLFSWPEMMFAQISLPIRPELELVPVLRVEMEIDTPKSAYERTNGTSPDHRRVGIGVMEIETRKASA